MADDELVCASWNQGLERIEARRQEVVRSYAQSGASPETLIAVRAYVTVLTQTYPEDVGELVDGRERRVFQTALLEGLELGASDPLIDTAIGSELDAFAAQVGIASADPSQLQIHGTADPVEMFSGQFVHEVDDLLVRGAGLDFVFRRTYRNQVRYSGPLGSNWDHSFNLWIREVGTDLLRSTGALREETYRRHPGFGSAGFDYWVPPDGQHGTIGPLGQSYVWRSPTGIRHLYQRDSSNPLLHRIARIEDRFGNRLVFTHAEDHLREVGVNHSGRWVRLDYDDVGRVRAVCDFSGRCWRYEYDDHGDLATVRTPPTGRYRGGLTTCYEYSSGTWSGPLAHNLLRVIDPAGRVCIDNEYGTEPGTMGFNRVTRQRQGSGESVFDYEAVVNIFEHDYQEQDRPAIRVNTVDRKGQPARHVYNAFGNLLLKEQTILAGGVRRLRWRSRYNRDGALQALLTPEGTLTQYYYGRDDYLRVHGIQDAEVATHPHLTEARRRSFGNLLAVVTRGERLNEERLALGGGPWGDAFPDVLRRLHPDDAVVKSTYEPDYQQPRTTSDPRFTDRADPRHVEGPDYDRTLTIQEYTGPAGDPNRLLARVRYPQLTLPDGTTLPSATEEFSNYDARGRLTRHVDRAGVVTETLHFGAADGVREGFVRAQVVDPGGLNVGTEYEINDLGIVTALRRPRAVGATAGRFVTRFDVNALDQVERTIASAPFGYESRAFYGPSGLLERSEEELLDEHGQPLHGGMEVHTYTYDDEKHRVEETLGGADGATHLITRHRYDAAGLRVLTVTPRGTAIVRTYDSRMQECAITRGACTPEASTVRFQYDGDGRKVASVSGRGDITWYAYDPLGRIHRTEDALGNLTVLHHDRAGNIVVERKFAPSAGGGMALLRRTEYAYDELNRRVRETHNLFPDPLPVADPETDFLDPPGPGQALSTLFFHDVKDRLVRVVDPEGREERTVFDALDRPVREVDPLGNRVETRYDAHGNVVRREVYEQVADPATGQVLGEEVFVAAFEFDELDRGVAATDGLGNTSRTAYDSRHRVRATTDGLGNMRRLAYDVYGRLVAETHERTTDGLGGGPPLPAAITRREYDDNGNVTAYVDARGARTEQAFDALDRRVVIRYPDGSASSVEYDADDHVVAAQAANGVVRRMTIDALGRVRRVEVDRGGLAPGAEVEGETFEAFTYDADDRILSEANDYAQVAKRFDSLGRCREERWTWVAPQLALGPLMLRREHDRVGDLTRRILPGGRTVRYERDALGRAELVRNETRGAGYPGASGGADDYPIMRAAHRGLRRSSLALGNGAGVWLAHDALGRVIEIDHLDASGSRLLRIQQLYDAAGNVRLRNELTPGSMRGEELRYDSTYQLTNIVPRGDIPPFTATDLAPPTVAPPDPIPDTQAAITALLGPLGQDSAGPGFGYDLGANRVEERRAGQPPVTYQANLLNQYQQVGSASYQHDRAGNLVADAARRYIYDARGLLVRVQHVATGQDVAAFFHDALGRRIAELRAGQTTNLLYDGLQVVEEYRAGVPHAQYVDDGDGDQVWQMSRGGADHWLHADTLGSIRLLTDAAGVLAGSTTYDLFGRTMAAGGVTTSFGFGGRRLDTDLGLYDFLTRTYAPDLGRFMQRDPKGPAGGVNPYQYALNNPVRFVDPLGTEPSEASKTLSRTLGGAAGALLNIYAFIEIATISWMDLLHVPINEYGQMRLRAAGEWFQSLYGAVDEGRFTGWMAEGTAQRMEAITALEAQGKHFEAGMVAGDTMMNGYFITRGGYSLARGGLRFGADVYSYGLRDATKGVGYRVANWATKYKEPTTHGGLGWVGETRSGQLRGSPFVNYQSHVATREIAQLTYVAEQRIRAGDANNIRAVRLYRAAIGTGLERATKGTAVNRVVDDMMANSSNPLLSSEILVQRAFGRNARGNLMFPDYRLNIGNQTVIDITSLGRAGKAAQYPAGNVVEIYHGTSRFPLGPVQILPLGGAGHTDESKGVGLTVAF
jgi:RHS repeat-associated protein